MPVRGGLLLTVGFVAVSGLSAGGCAGGQRQSALMASDDAVVASTVEARLENVELARFASSEIEVAADRIRDLSEDASVRTDALLWKLNGISRVQTAALGPDPYVNVIDLWVLLLQMREFFEEGAGREAFGEYAHVAVAATEQMLERSQGALDRMTKYGGQAAAPDVERWAQEHPIQGFEFQRESVPVQFASTLRGEEEGGLGALYDTQASLSRLEYRVALMNEWVPKIAQWSAELAATDLLELEQIDTTLSNANGLMTGMPELVASERQAVIEDIQTLVEEQRAIVFDTVARERNLLVDTIDRQRQLALQDVNGLVASQGRDLVDFVLWRIAQIVLGLLLVVAAAWGYRRHRQRRTEPSHPLRRSTDRPRRRATDFEPGHAH